MIRSKQLIKEMLKLTHMNYYHALKKIKIKMAKCEINIFHGL